MTSTHVGLPDRYRPLDQVGPEEATPTGVIRTWRAKDRVLNRDVAIRVHTPGGPAAHGWIARALTAGGLATPALAMVYDAAEGSADPEAAGGAAYVVNEWIEGQTLADRVAQGPMADREARTVLRRLAEGVAEAHRVGLAVGGLTPGNVVLRPNGLVGLRGVPAATGTVAGDIAALGELLEFCLTGGTGADAAALGSRGGIAPDLAALVRRARSAEPGQGLTSVAAMAALLAERRGGQVRPGEPPRGDAAARAPRHAPDYQSAPAAPRAEAAPTVAVGGPPVAPPAASPHAPAGDRADDRADEEARWDPPWTGEGTDGGFEHAAGWEDEEFADEGGERTSTRRRLVVFGLPLLALALVIALAVWFGSSVLSVAGSVDEGSPAPVPTTAPSSSAAPTSASAAPTGGALDVRGVSVFDPYGDGESENRREAPLATDGKPDTVWSTLVYRGSAHFGNLKPGVGLVLDLGSPQPVGGVTLTTTMPGSTVEVRTGANPDGTLDDFTVAGTATLEDTTPVRFPRAVTTRYVLVWLTGLVPTDGGFAANLAEVTVQRAG